METWDAIRARRKSWGASGRQLRGKSSCRWLLRGRVPDGSRDGHAEARLGRVENH